MSANVVVASQESVHSNTDISTLTCKDRLETEQAEVTELKDLNHDVVSTVINEMHVPGQASTGTEQQLSKKAEVSVLEEDGDISSVTQKESTLEVDDATFSVMKNKPPETQNCVQSIPESLDIEQNTTCDTESANPKGQSCQKMDKVCKTVQMDYRGIDSNSVKSDTSSPSSGDESSSELSESVGPAKESPGDVGEDDDEDEDDGGKRNLNSGKTKVSWPQSLPRTKGELCLDDLPPIEDLTITVGDDVKMVEVGKITSTVHTLVVVQAKADLPPLNEDTVLFLEGKKVLGQVFETFGPVSAPLYSVRFNTPEQIQERELHPGLVVFYVPDAPEYTHYVFMAHLQSIKASDASWEHNNEPPPQCLDYSDDEEERRAKGQLKQERRNRMHHDDDDSGNMTKGRKPKRKPRVSYGHEEDVPTSKSSQRKPVGTGTWPPKDCQSWPPNDRISKYSQNGRMSSANSYSLSLHADTSNSQNYKFMGFRPTANRFMHSHSQEKFGRGEPRNQQPSALDDSLLGAPRGGFPPSGLSVMPPATPGMGPSVPPPSFMPRHPPPRIPSHGSLYPRNMSSEPSHSIPPRHMMNMQPPNSGQQSWQPPHTQPFNLPSQSADNGQPSRQSIMLPYYPSHVRPPPPGPRVGGGGGMGFSYDSNHSAMLDFSGTPPYNKSQQQFGGEPHFSRGPVGSFGTNWGVNHSCQQ